MPPQTYSNLFYPRPTLLRPGERARRVPPSYVEPNPSVAPEDVDYTNTNTNQNDNAGTTGTETADNSYTIQSQQRDSDLSDIAANRYLDAFRPQPPTLRKRIGAALYGLSTGAPVSEILDQPRQKRIVEAGQQFDLISKIVGMNRQQQLDQYNRTRQQQIDDLNRQNILSEIRDRDNPPTRPDTSQTADEMWLASFKQQYGRNPTADEVQKHQHPESNTDKNLTQVDIYDPADPTGKNYITANYDSVNGVYKRQGTGEIIPNAKKYIPPTGTPDDKVNWELKEDDKGNPIWVNPRNQQIKPATGIQNTGTFSRNAAAQSKTEKPYQDTIDTAGQAEQSKLLADNGNAEADVDLALDFFKVIRGDASNIRFNQSEQNLIFQARNAAGGLQAFAQKVIGGGQKFTPTQRQQILEVIQLHSKAAQQALDRTRSQGKTGTGTAPTQSTPKLDFRPKVTQ